MNRKTIAASLAAAALLVLSLCFPAVGAKACAEGVALWANAVLPTLFPFLVLTALLTRLGAAECAGRLFAPLTKKLRLPDCAAVCMLLGVLSGYPVGCRALSEFQGRMREGQALRAAALCSVSGPMFVIGTVGGAMFQCARAGALLFCSHLLGVVLVFLCTLPFARRAEEERTLPAGRSADAVLAESVQGAVVSILCVGGFIAFFGAAAALLQAAGILAPLQKLIALPLSAAGAENCAEGALAGLLEATRGCALLAGAGGTLALPLAAFTVTFGGASILAQQLAFLKKLKVRAGAFVALKFAQGVAAFGICLLLCGLFQ